MIDFGGSIDKARMLCNTIEAEESPEQAQKKAKRLEEVAMEIHDKAVFAVAVNSLQKETVRLKEKGFSNMQIREALKKAERIEEPEELKEPKPLMEAPPQHEESQRKKRGMFPARRKTRKVK